MKRGLLVAVGGAAIMIAGLSGCSSGDKASESSSASSSASSEASSSSESASATAAPGGGTKVTIDGQDQNVSGTVVCATMGNVVSINIGEGMTGIAAVVSSGDAPSVTSVALGNVNGVSLAMGPGAGEATATKDGSTYTISGNATGIDTANPMAPVTKPFEIVATCP